MLLTLHAGLRQCASARSQAAWVKHASYSNDWLDKPGAKKRSRGLLVQASPDEKHRPTRCFGQPPPPTSVIRRRRADGKMRRTTSCRQPCGERPSEPSSSATTDGGPRP